MAKTIQLGWEGVFSMNDAGTNGFLHAKAYKIRQPSSHHIWKVFQNGSKTSNSYKKTQGKFN